MVNKNVVYQLIIGRILLYSINVRNTRGFVKCKSYYGLNYVYANEQKIFRYTQIHKSYVSTIYKDPFIFSLFHSWIIDWTTLCNNHLHEIFYCDRRLFDNNDRSIGFSLYRFISVLCWNMLSRCIAYYENTIFPFVACSRFLRLR